LRVFNGGNDIIGFIKVSIRENPRSVARENIGYVEGWYIVKEYRNQGAGRRLLELAEKWSITKGCNKIASDTNIDNKTSKAIPLKLGFKEGEKSFLFLKRYS